MDWVEPKINLRACAPKTALTAAVSAISPCEVLVPWALGCFAANSAQQARLVNLSPQLAPATVALNTSAMYAGQAMGSALGGWMIAQGQMAQLHWVSLGLLLLAMALSAWASRAAISGRRPPGKHPAKDCSPASRGR